MTNSFFTRLEGDTYRPTIHAEGAWSKDDYHFAALAGLITHVIERSRDSNLDLSRISFDILCRLPFQDVTITTEIKRPGRTIELVEATATIQDRPVIIARAWYLVTSDTTEAQGIEYEPLPKPADCPPREFNQECGGGYIAQVEARQAVEKRAGRGATWLTSPNTLVDGDTPVPLAEFICRVDAANGINPRQSHHEWAFPNVDLTIHLFRQPDGEWTGLDTAVTWGPHGIVLTASTLHDVHGPVGRAEQSLTIRKM